MIELLKNLKELEEAANKLSVYEMHMSPSQQNDNELAFRTVGFEDVSDKADPSHYEGTIAEFFEHDYEGYAEFFCKAVNSSATIREARRTLESQQWQINLSQSNFEHYFKKYLQATGKTVNEAEAEWEQAQNGR